jgi:PKD repeat protein
VTTNTVGSGTVNKTPDQATYHYNDTVQLEAVPDPDWTFSHWSGDLTGNTNPDTITVTGDMTITATFTELGNQPPVADAGPDVNAKKLEYITFDGTGSYDPDGTITDYSWDFGDRKTGTGPTVVHKYTKTGIFTVTLTVTDDSGAQDQDTAIATITK